MADPTPAAPKPGPSSPSLSGPNWAVYLAHEIEWTHALERGKWEAIRRRLGGRVKLSQLAAAEFDPHAATELAYLIESRARAALLPVAPKEESTDASA